MARNKSRARILHELRVENDRLRRELENEKPLSIPCETYGIVPVTVESMIPAGFATAVNEEEIPLMRERLKEKLIMFIAEKLSDPSKRFTYYYTRETDYGTVYGIRMFMVKGDS